MAVQDREEHVHAEHVSEGQQLLASSIRMFYYFCRACGGDTAAYEQYTACPYCRAGRPHLVLVGTRESGADDAAARQALRDEIERLRAAWVAEHRPRRDRGGLRRWFGRH
ncbi:hypothetical protein [Alicyclobacillus cellulosilyticus]|uniref:hypothetical protein n=1 Tax=Alicyclobacillus cellulosilyticus TaxID=1003997 RepID=UPI00166B73D3|nr:hypothetical protein [Alicyclobacillus cellulosilyticus]